MTNYAATVIEIDSLNEGSSLEGRSGNIKIMEFNYTELQFNLQILFFSN